MSQMGLPCADALQHLRIASERDHSIFLRRVFSGKHQLFTALNRPISIVNSTQLVASIPYACAIGNASLL
jgi:hypothetical protein